MKINYKAGEITIAILILLFVWIVYTWLFMYADRKIVFLYDHLGSTPFDSITSGRYWMAGLLLSGFISVFYYTVRLAAGSDIEVSWQGVMKKITIPLFVGIIFIMMTMGSPKMPLLIAISSATATTIGLCIGLSVADDLMTHLLKTIAATAIGSGFVPFLILFRVLELPSNGIVTLNLAIWIVVLSVLAGFIWLWIATYFFRIYAPSRFQILKGILFLAYLVLPVIHYLFATPKGIPYITSSSNFFANNILLRFINWILLVVFVYTGYGWATRQLYKKR